MMFQAAQAEREEELAACERACTEHYLAQHRLRLRLWRRLGWAWLMRWPTREPRALAVGQTAFDPVRFIINGPS